jgi:hypothetical protein
VALWERHIFTNEQELTNFLNGALIGIENLAQGAEVDGLTFIVDVGSGEKTTTFTPAKSRPWTAAEIVAKINATVSGLAQAYSRNYPNHQMRGVDQRILLVNDGSLTVKSTGTANALLGFSTTGNTVQVPVATAEVPNISHNGITNTWTAIVYR